MKKLKYKVGQDVKTDFGNGVIVGIDDDSVPYIVKIEGFEYGHNGYNDDPINDRRCLIDGSCDSLENDGMWFKELFLSPIKLQNEGMPNHFITMGQALVDTYGEDQALKQIEDNLVMLMRSRSILVEHKADTAIKLNLAQQIDMWEQIKKSIE